MFWLFNWESHDKETTIEAVVRAPTRAEAIATAGKEVVYLDGGKWTCEALDPNGPSEVLLWTQQDWPGASRR